MRATFVFILAAACSLVTAYPAARALSSTTPRVLSESPNASFGTTHQPRTHDGHIPAAERKGKILLSNSGMGSPPHDSTLRARRARRRRGGRARNRGSRRSRRRELGVLTICQNILPQPRELGNP
ncbi:hypothetical protein PLICRDRAFT_41085 [Plicaturopsis crispa FD-325 SS-3]|nr:hypothetical protein PLICRDRAFT_41085 [Plicaturopsis crispa FD-325 SS-3]